MTNPTMAPPSLASADHFDLAALTRVLEARETDFEAMYDMAKHTIEERKGSAAHGWHHQDQDADFYLFKDNGSKILAVAHLDTVGPHHERTCHYIDSADGPLVYSRALDDRLGAYVLAELLPSMGLTFDLLLTVGEEDGMSTAEFFDPKRHHERDYNWIIEFDRGGTDVVLYQYHDRALERLVEATGARVEHGAFSDISYMEHLGIKAMNWGVGYRDYHGPRAHVWLDDMFTMVDYFLDFHDEHAETRLPHVKAEPRLARGASAYSYGSGYRRTYGQEEEWYFNHHRSSTEPTDTELGAAPVCEMGALDEGIKLECEGEVTEHRFGDVLCVKHAEWFDR